MIKAAPPIQTPSSAITGQLAQLIEDGLVTSGPVLCFDPSRRCFLVAVVEQGVIVHWQIESCQDHEEAQHLRSRYVGFVEEVLSKPEMVEQAELGGKIWRPLH